ncbi:hypothetical protein C8Q70DRAFT_262758 [Cubamyces menziesii]|nr:hypothetical protein C8Q70DRAFT_262758 [Cubamyces menziesii]
MHLASTRDGDRALSVDDGLPSVGTLLLALREDVLREAGQGRGCFFPFEKINQPFTGQSSGLLLIAIPLPLLLLSRPPPCPPCLPSSPSPLRHLHPSPAHSLRSSTSVLYHDLPHYESCLYDPTLSSMAVEPNVSTSPRTSADSRTDFIEQIFQKVEEETERRAQAQQEYEETQSRLQSRVASPAPAANPTPRDAPRDRRRGSISVSRFGQSRIFRYVREHEAKHPREALSAYTRRQGQRM